MDNYDKEILKELRENGRITNQELSDRINLSPSPCLRRVRALEKSGMIAGYTARMSQKALGYEVTLFVRIKIQRHSKDAVEQVENSIKLLEDVVSCYLIGGAYDYLLHVVVRDLDDYERFLRNELHRIPGISEIDSGFAYGCIKPPSTLFV